MAKAAKKSTRVAPKHDAMKFIELESQIHNIADMANLVMGHAEKYVEGGVMQPGKPEVYIPEDDRNSLMFGLRQLNLLACALRGDFYAACENKAEVDHAA